jgi:hypothetical protein
LDQRIQLRYHIPAPALTAAEAEGYIRRHLEHAGRSDTLFSDDAVHAIHAHARCRHQRLPGRYNMPFEPAGPGCPQVDFARPDDALAWYYGEHFNLISATKQASASGLHDIAWRLAAPLFAIAGAQDNWDNRYWADLIASHRVALDSAHQAGNRQGEAWILNNLGVAFSTTGDSEGIGCLEQALAIRREIGDRLGEALMATYLTSAGQQLHQPGAGMFAAGAEDKATRQAPLDADAAGRTAATRITEANRQAQEPADPACADGERCGLAAEDEQNQVHEQAEQHRHDAQDADQRAAAAEGQPGNARAEAREDTSREIEQPNTEELLVALLTTLADAMGGEQAAARAEALIRSWRETPSHTPEPPQTPHRKGDLPKSRSPATVTPDIPRVRSAP